MSILLTRGTQRSKQEGHKKPLAARKYRANAEEVRRLPDTIFLSATSCSIRLLVLSHLKHYLMGNQSCNLHHQSFAKHQLVLFQDVLGEVEKSSIPTLQDKISPDHCQVIIQEKSSNTCDHETMDHSMIYCCCQTSTGVHYG